jgi:hypothetical protein
MCTDGLHRTGQDRGGQAGKTRHDRQVIENKREIRRVKADMSLVMSQAMF